MKKNYICFTYYLRKTSET